jgi:tetratricopeptide (TPR) repeat protein
MAPNLGLIAAQKTSTMVNRRDQLEQIRQAIYEAGDALRVVLVRGPVGAEEHDEPEGGYGKTRLLEEVLRRARPGGEWERPGKVAVSELIDLIDIRVHAQSNFLHTVRDSFVGSLDLSGYDDAFNSYRRRVAQGMDYWTVREEAERADRVFLTDYRAGAETQRIVWLLDTVEQLAIFSSDWLLQRGLLTAKDMQARTLEWLKRQIADKALPNTTLICAGRGREGKRFFDEISAVTRAAYGDEAVVNVYVEPFDEDDTRQYFEMLAADLRDKADKASSSQATTYDLFARSLAELAQRGSDRAKVVWLYTGGVPVRLALYAQLLAQGGRIPEPLQWSWEKAVTVVKTDTPTRSTRELELTQWKVEEHFINLLFDPRNAADLGFRILRALVRARRGLTAEQLHFVLDNAEGLAPKDWDKVIDRRRIQTIDEQLEQMERLFMVKRRPAWWQLHDPQGPALGAERRGLQDEIYRIYAEHMAPQADPANNLRMQRIWATQAESEAERDRYYKNRRDEQEERLQLYRRLREWAICQRTKLQQQQREYRDSEERALPMFNPVEARRITFLPLSESAQVFRTAIKEAVRELSLEQMYYGLLINPEKGYNEDYNRVLFRTLSTLEDAEFEVMIQAEMWRVLYDDDALRFVDFESRKVAAERGETTLQVMRRVAQQDDVTQWIKRFVFRKEYARAIEFAERLEQEIEKLKGGGEQDRKDWISWGHTYARGDRLCWRKYAQVLLAQDIPEAIGTLKTIVEKLEHLARTPIPKVAFPPDQTATGCEEMGFKGVRDSDLQKPTPHHPAYLPLRRTISFIYNVLGYACVNIGQLHGALEYYGKALYYLRETGAGTHRANVLNNLSRVLSDMGRHQAVRICRDALEIRKMWGNEVSIAYSHNTLALIYNDRNRPEDAWIPAAKAMAYFRRAEEPRGLGLALLQLGEALRRIASRARAGEVLSAEADQLYGAAEDLLTEAHSIFLRLTEPLRLIEAKIELGCLHRDRIRMVGSQEFAPRWQMRYREALNSLEQAAREADRLGLERHALDARVNLAWTHYYAAKFTEASNILDKVEQGLTKNCFILPKSEKQPEGFAPNPAKRPEEDGELFVFAQLSKIYNLRGLMALEQFTLRVDAIGKNYPDDKHREYCQALVHADSEAQDWLDKAAEHYTLGTSYAQLYSPRSGALSLLYDRLYGYFKKFDGTEQDDFFQHVKAQREKYPMQQIRANIEDLGNIEQFLHEVSGLSDELLKYGGLDE